MDQWATIGGAFVLGFITALALLGIHRRGIRQAVAECKAAGAERIEYLQDRLDKATEHAAHGIELAQQRQLQDVWRTGYLHGFQAACTQQTVRRIWR